MKKASKKSHIIKFLVMIFALCMAIGYVNTEPVRAASKASYTIQKKQKKKTYKKSSAVYLYELPVLKGKSAAIKKINNSLNAAYTKSLTNQKNLFDTFQKLKKDGTLKKKTLHLQATTKCKESYNKNGYVKFAFTTTWYDGTTRKTTKKTAIYRLKDGTRVKKLPKKKTTEEEGLELIQGTWYSVGGLPYNTREVISGNKITSYVQTSSVPSRVYTIEKVYKTSYGYYFRFPLGQGYYAGYRLNLSDKKMLVNQGNGDPYSSSGYSMTSSMVRSK